MASIFFLAIIYNVPKWMMFKWETNPYGVGELKPTKLACDPTFYNVYYAGGNGLFMFILPTLMLIIPNVLMQKEVLIADIIEMIMIRLCLFLQNIWQKCPLESMIVHIL